MNSRARVEAAISGGKVDRPPAGAWGHNYRAEQSAADLARFTAERARQFGWDFVKFQPRASCFAEAFGAEWIPSRHPFHSPKPGAPAVPPGGDWGDVPEATAAAPALADQVDAIGRTVRELGPDVPVIQTVFSPLTVAGYLAGKDPARVVRELKANPGALRPALERITAALIDFSQQSVAAGAAGVFYAISGYLSRDRFRPEDYERLVLPWDLAVLEALPAAGWFNVLHTCGSNLNFDLVRQMPNVQVQSWSIHNKGNPSLAEGRERSGRPVMGGIDQRAALDRGTTEQVAAQVRDALGATGGTGFLLAPGCSVPPRAPAGNLEAMMQAVAA